MSLYHLSPPSLSDHLLSPHTLSLSTLSSSTISLNPLSQPCPLYPLSPTPFSLPHLVFLCPLSPHHLSLSTLPLHHLSPPSLSTHHHLSLTTFSSPTISLSHPVSAPPLSPPSLSIIYIYHIYSKHPGRADSIPPSTYVTNLSVILDRHYTMSQQASKLIQSSTYKLRLINVIRTKLTKPVVDRVVNAHGNQ